MQIHCRLPPLHSKINKLVSQRKRQVIASILTFIFVLYYANITFFYHSHNIDGFTIFHSHMHSTAHTQSGTHTASELSLISALSSFQTLQAILFFCGLGLLFLSAIVSQIDTEKKAISISLGNVGLRAPPVSI